LPAPDGATRRQRRALASVLRAVPDVVITVPRGDLRQTAERRPSPWLAQLVDAATRHDREVASFGSGVEWSAFPATAQEHRLRSVARHARAGGHLDDHALAASDVPISRALRLVRARESVAFTPYDGNLSS